MKNKAIKFGLIASLLPHLFCCVLPVVLSLIGLFAPEVAHTEFVPEWVENWLFVFSAFMLGVSWILILHDCPCAHNHTEHAHYGQKIILAVITCLFIISLIVHNIYMH